MQAGSWTDLSTILETRSAQSSPAGGGGSIAGGEGPGGAGGGAGAGPWAVSRASSERSSTTAAGGLERRSGAAAHYGATHFPSMPVSAYAGAGGYQQPVGPPAAGAHPGMSNPGAAGSGAGGEASGSRKGGRRVVSLLAKGLKSMGQKQTWASLLPNVTTGGDTGPGGGELGQGNEARGGLCVQRCAPVQPTCCAAHAVLACPGAPACAKIGELMSD